MNKRTKLIDVAKTAGVSLATVSQVMRGVGRISEDTRNKVLSAAKAINYVPDARAASMRSGVSREVGLLIHHISNPFNAEVTSGISDTLDSHNYLLSILDGHDDFERQERQIKNLLGHARGGLIWVPAMNTPDATFELLKRYKLPTVTFLRRAGRNDFDHLGIDNAGATYEATKHLLQQGHEHIAFFGGRKDVETRLERIRGYTLAMQEFAHTQSIVFPCVQSKTGGLEGITQLRSQYPQVSAIVCNGDQVALGAMIGLQKTGIQVGKKFSVVGFDDIEDAKLAIPTLTTLAIHPYELGQKLAKILLERVNNYGGSVQLDLVNPDFVLRNSG